MTPGGNPITVITIMLATSMMTHARLVNCCATAIWAKLARLSVSTTPHTATNAVSNKAVNKSGFLKIGMPFVSSVF